MIDLTGRQPAWPPPAEVLLSDCLADAVRVSGHWRTPPPAGMPILREQLALLLGTSAECIAVTSGVRAALALLDRARPMTTVLERPGFAGLPSALGFPAPGLPAPDFPAPGFPAPDFPALGFPAPGFPARYIEDWPSMRDAPGDAAGRRMVVTAPCRNPDGANMSSADLDLLANGGPPGDELVVNEIYRWAVSSPVPGGADWYVGSLAKVAGGGMRVGWLRSTDPAALREVVVRNTAVPPRAWQLAVAGFLRRHGLDLLTPRYCRAPVAAREAFVAGLAARHPAVPAIGAGPFLLLPVPDESAVVSALQERGVAVGPGRDFLAEDPCVRLCFTAVSEVEARAAAEIVSDVVFEVGS